VGATPSNSAATKPAGTLLTVLGPAFGVAVVVGGAVGVGILKQPGVVAQHIPDPLLFLGAWLAGGIYVMLGAVSVSELAAMSPKSGAWYVYTRRAMGEYAGFVTGWGHWLGLCSGAAWIYLQLANYIVNLVRLDPVWSLPIALATSILLAATHWRSVHQAGKIQELTTLVKGLAFLALVVAFVARGDAGPGAAFTSMPNTADWLLLGGAVVAVQAILQTYDGWEGAIYFGEEVRDPGRNLPRSIILGTLAIVVLYLLVNASLLCVLSIDQIAGQEMAIARASEAVFGPLGGTIVFALATLSIVAACNAGTLQTPRVLFAMSRDRLFFPQAAQVNAGGTPTVSLLLTTVAIVFFLVTGTIDQLLGVLAFFLVANYSLVFLALFVLRVKEPNAVRPFRAWGFPWTPGLALAGSLVYLGSSIWLDRENSFYALGLLAASLPMYLVVRLLRERNSAAG
jgi:APA family basic amino acid/polyamine antiporter